MDNKTQHPTHLQHYVPQKYLKAWCDKDDRMFLCQDGKIISNMVKTTKVAGENFIYSLQDISLFELKFAIDMLERIGLNTYSIQEIVKLVLMPIWFYKNSNNSQSLKDLSDKIEYLKKKNYLDQETLELISNEMIIQNLEHLGKIEDIAIRKKAHIFYEKVNKEGLEGLCQNVEGDFWPILDRIIANDKEIFEDKEQYKRCIEYMMLQYFRTPLLDKKLENIYKMINKAHPEYNLSNIKNFIKIGYFQKLYSYIASNSNYKLLIIENNTNTDFLTSDQPIINLCSNVPTDYFDLYFPVTPRKCIFLNQNDRIDCYPELICKSSDDIDTLNKKIISNSTRQIFSDSKELLYKYENEIKKKWDKTVKQ